MRRPKIFYLSGKPTEYYKNFSFGPACLTKTVAASGGEFNPRDWVRVYWKDPASFPVNWQDLYFSLMVSRVFPFMVAYLFP